MPKTKMKDFGASGRTGHDSAAFYQRKMYSEARSAPSTSGTQAGGMEPSSLPLNWIFPHTSETMHELPDGSVHLMVTSPPYNVGKRYEEDLSRDEYRTLLRRVWKETYRVLAPGGRACINVANLGRRPYIPLNALITTDMMELGYLMRGEIIWNKAASAGVSCAWGSWRSPSNPVLRDVHEYILVFSKEEFRRPPAGGAATVSKEDFLACTQSVWDIPTESARKVGHPAPFPIELPRRLIELYTYTNDLVLDPFMGSGTTAVAAAMGDRRWVGYETEAEYVELARRRLESLSHPPVSASAAESMSGD